MSSCTETRVGVARFPGEVGLPPTQSAAPEILSVEVRVIAPAASPAKTLTSGMAGRSWYLPFKMALDFVAAALLLLLASPLLLLAAILVKLTSRGPIIYSQVRLGKNGRPYSIFKLRTMWHDCERQSGVRWSTPGDKRITPVGRFLRRTHIDELPQLWNVLRGDMSLVGPRPERPEFVPHLEQTLPRYRERLRLRPGITGLAQVQLSPDTDLNSVRRKLDCDLHYIQKLGFWLDFRILLATAFKVMGIPMAFSRSLLRLASGNKPSLAKPNVPADPVLVAEPQPA